MHFPALYYLYYGFKPKRGCSYYKQQKVWEWSPGATWDRARLQEIEASFWETWLLRVCERRFEKKCESFQRILFPPSRSLQTKALGRWYHIRITIMSLYVCACLSYIQLSNPVHNFLSKKKKSEGYFTRLPINSLSPLQEKITLFSDCNFNLLYSNK